MTDELIFRNDEWEVEGALLYAEVEIVLNWSWRNGKPEGFTVWCFDRLDAGYDKRPAWLGPILDAWAKANQKKLLMLWDERQLAAAE